ncbi:hypothetical protein J3R82DRAFT_6066 [Butyriboletus roseoflavus]|nr:hypothetical protein J3R82DRAFT_6066 [Butyriboletus roseoflavus]
MEVDMQSPPSTFRPVAFAIKRPRSPSSPTQERQTKRLSLVPVGSEGQCVRRASVAPDGVADGRVPNQDDWVRQARELSITSPLSITVGFPSVLDGGATGALSRVDEHMAVDDEESQVLRVHPHPGGSRPWSTTKCHLPSIHISTTATQTSVPVPSGLHAPSPAPFSVLTEPPSSSSESASPTSSISVTETSVGAHQHLCPPDIFLLPATPSDTPPHQHQFASEYGQPVGENEPGPHARMQDQNVSQSSLTQTPERTHGSPRPSRAPDVPTSSGRKHRVTMGPRADCTKCRTGVRGHWMHFD